MCGRYQFDFSDPVRFRTRYGIGGKYPEAQIKTRHNVVPGQMMPVVIANGSRSVAMMRWGFIPSWEKSASPRGLINLRDDTVTAKPWALRYLESSRCLIPASGFYEWKKTEENTVPYYIRLAEDYFSFAGLYSTWKHPATGEEIRSYAILTTSPNGFMEKIHHRMPVILERKEEATWLHHGSAEIGTLKELLHPYRGEMKAYPVSRRVNNPDNDDDEVIQPAG